MQLLAVVDISHIKTLFCSKKKKKEKGERRGQRSSEDVVCKANDSNELQIHNTAVFILGARTQKKSWQWGKKNIRCMKIAHAVNGHSLSHLLLINNAPSSF